MDSHTSKSPETLPHSEHAKPTIILIDDHVDGLLMVSELLKFCGYAVHAADNGALGLRLAEEHQPDVMIVDLAMPEMDGFAVAKQVRERLRKRLKLIALSGHGGTEMRTRSKEAGFHYHLLKPIDVEVLISSIEGHSESSRL